MRKRDYWRIRSRKARFFRLSDRGEIYLRNHPINIPQPSDFDGDVLNKFNIGNIKEGDGYMLIIKRRITGAYGNKGPIKINKNSEYGSVR